MNAQEKNEYKQYLRTQHEKRVCNFYGIEPTDSTLIDKMQQFYEEKLSTIPQNYNELPTEQQQNFKNYLMKVDQQLNSWLQLNAHKI